MDASGVGVGVVGSGRGDGNRTGASVDTAAAVAVGSNVAVICGAGDAPLIDQTCDLRPATGLLLFDLDRVDLRPRRGRRRRIARRDLVQDITPRYDLSERGVTPVQGGLRRVVDEPLASAGVRRAGL